MANNILMTSLLGEALCSVLRGAQLAADRGDRAALALLEDRGVLPIVARYRAERDHAPPAHVDEAALIKAERDFDDALARLDAMGCRPGCVVETIEDAERFIDSMRGAGVVSPAAEVELVGSESQDPGMAELLRNYNATLGARGEPPVTSIKAAFLEAFEAQMNDDFSSLMDPGANYGDFGGADDYKTDLDNAIGAALDTMGVMEPEGSSLDWKGTLHDWIEEAHPRLAEANERFCADDGEDDAAGDAQDDGDGGERPVEVACPHCGSTNVKECWKVTEKHSVLRWVQHKSGAVEAAEYADRVVLDNSTETLDAPYDCGDCGAIEMTAAELVVRPAE